METNSKFPLLKIAASSCNFTNIYSYSCIPIPAFHIFIYADIAYGIITVCLFLKILPRVHAPSLKMFPSTPEVSKGA